MRFKIKRYISARILLLAVLFSALLAMAAMVAFYWVQTSYLAVLLPLGVLAMESVAVYAYVYKPYRETEKLLTLFAAGYTVEDTLDMRYPFSPGTEAAIGRIRNIFATKEFISASKRQAQYLALQNQINPHFLYNTLEGIRSDALIAGAKDIAEMTEALSTFFRYTISNLENLVSLEEELHNVENYFHIQQYRFGERLEMRIEYDEADKQELLRCRLLKLTLQPIAENAIVHGLEQRLSDGLLRIRLELTNTRLLITVSDNGVGMQEAKLDALNAHLNAAYFETAQWQRSYGGIALINVNNRIKLLFGEEYGIYIYSVEGEGTDVRVTLPRTLDDQEARRVAEGTARRSMV
ncbi:MAG: sensor histidine kinase [Clostridia bacterium]|nr:sensor histidine kinase [Candidatus Pelethousia sp.]NCB30244.1 sensor histidine kinase [Clostridia bacterium]